MYFAACVLAFVLAGGPPEPQTHFEQVHPELAAGICKRSPDQKRAVILIHGLIFSLHKDHVALAGPQHWQEAGGLLVRSLGKEADVFSFAYGQNLALERVADSRGLKSAVSRVRDLGYSEIILVGHSAGGLVARQFVEDNPDAGVTRLIQVCAPNSGSKLATFPGILENQRPFVNSLTPAGRTATLQKRADKKLPAKVECVCVLGCGLGNGDGAVSCASQWPHDLQLQGVRVVTLEVLHFQPMLNRKGVACLCDLVRRDQPRWSEREVEEARKKIRPGGVLLER